MPQEVVVGILIALVVVLGILFLLPKPNPEVEIVKFLAETLSKDYVVRFGDFRGETPYEEAAGKIFIAEILSRNGYMIADRERFFKTRWEEQALADLGLLRDLNFGKPEMARYSVAVDALKDSLKISVGDLSSSLVRTRVFPLPDRYKKLLEAVYGISPRVIELRHEYQQKDIVVKMIVNYPFTEKIAVTVNNNTYGVYSVTREEFSFKIQDVRPGASYDVALTPLDRRNRPGIVFSRRIIAELPPNRLSV